MNDNEIGSADKLRRLLQCMLTEIINGHAGSRASMDKKKTFMNLFILCHSRGKNKHIESTRATEIPLRCVYCEL